MVGEIYEASLNHDDLGQKRTKLIFHDFHTLLAMKNVATSTHVLIARILTVKACAFQAFLAAGAP